VETSATTAVRKKLRPGGWSPAIGHGEGGIAEIEGKIAEMAKNWAKRSVSKKSAVGGCFILLECMTICYL
jgi:hypothetical protein